MSAPMTTERSDLRSHLPDPSRFFPGLRTLAGAMSKATRNGATPQTAVSLVQLRASQIVGSTYHAVRQTGLLRKAGETVERITPWRHGATPPASPAPTGPLWNRACGHGREQERSPAVELPLVLGPVSNGEYMSAAASPGDVRVRSRCHPTRCELAAAWVLPGLGSRGQMQRERADENGPWIPARAARRRKQVVIMRARAGHLRFPVSWMLAVCCAAAAVAGCGSGSSGPDVLTAPVHVVRTADGTVGYRELGSGPALLLITGADASMDDWPASFVDALAAHHQVVVFDNAGVGRTSAVSAPASLSIPAMASQASALISALRLHRPAVLGWSMGGMIAQALAISHPAQVSRLILAASAVGTGKAVPLPPSAAMFALSPAEIVAQMFPKNQAAAARAYANDSLQYPGSYQVSAATFHAQYLAAERWLAGQDAAGRLVGEIRVPTLVADGTLDQDTGPANARLLASSVPGAKLVLYDDAGHAFLFQDAASFIRAVETFMG